MKKRRNNKFIALIITICMLFGMINNNANYAKADPMELETTYYVGGLGASDINDGTSSALPFSTLSKAAVIINARGEGSYNIVIQGNTEETDLVQIGDGSQAIHVTMIENAVSGSAIVMRAAGNTGNMILVKNMSTLTLGDSSGLGTTELTFDGGYVSGGLTGNSIINNDGGGTLNLYQGVTLQNNYNDSLTYDGGGGICNRGTVHMEGGTISNNYSSKGYGGGVSNWGAFYMESGTISENVGTGIVAGGGVSNRGDFYMNGGYIINNTANYAGGVISAFGSFTMTEGEISGNEAIIGGGMYLYQESDFTMTGGTISNNIAYNGGAIFTYDTFTISGNASIPAGENNVNNILLCTNVSEEIYIRIGGSLSGEGNICIDPDGYKDGKQVLIGTDSLLIENASKFFLNDAGFSINNEGKMRYIATPVTYYVDAVNGNDDFDGTSSEEPFATLNKALMTIDYYTGTVIIQSDLTITSQFYVRGNITILSDGTKRTITRDKDFTNAMIFVYGGTLTLGDSNNDAVEETLVFNDECVAPLNVLIINNSGQLNLYSGVAITNAKYFKGAVANYKATMNMYGGRISGSNEIGVDNLEAAIFNFSGGTIDGNIGVNGVGVKNIGIFNMSGSSIISGINGTNGIGVKNDKTFTMSGGTIRDNICAVNNTGYFNLSNNAFIPVGDNNTNDVYLQNRDGYNYWRINLENNLSVEQSILITLDDYISGRQVIDGEVSVIESNRNKFVLRNSDFGVNEVGNLDYIGAPIIYYVSALGDDDGNDGSESSPFATIQRAADEIGAGIGKGTIIIDSDLTLDNAIYIDSNITIQSNDNEVTTIRRAASFQGDMIIVVGELTLGNSINNGDDKNPTLIFDGEISNGYGSIIYNDGILNMYRGVALQNNINDYGCGGVYNNYEGTFNMYGGSIINNEGRDGGGVYLYAGSTFTMVGGSIHNNTGDYGGGVYIEEQGSFLMTGGSITSNTGINGGAVYNKGTYSMSGSASIPVGVGETNDVYLDKYKYITLEGNLTSSDNILLTLNNYLPGTQVLYGVTSVLQQSYNKFVFMNSINDFIVSSEGEIEYKGISSTYYVNSLGSDDNDGITSSTPLKTLQKAVTEIGNGVGTIMISSDLTLEQPIIVSGTITLLNDGVAHTITHDEAFVETSDPIYSGENSMIIVSGKLILGDIEYKGEADTLIFDGVNNVTMYGAIINNYSMVDMYNGVSLQNNFSNDDAGGVINKGLFHMYGGTIRDNKSYYVGGVNNQNIFILSGGNINNNTADYYGGVKNDGNVTMTGGNINNNSGEFTAGVYNNNTFHMSGGNINNNIGGYTGGVDNEHTFTMSGGNIDENIGGVFGGGVYNCGTFTMSDGSIDGNSSSLNYGTGAFNDVDGSFILSNNATIVNNNDICLINSDYGVSMLTIGGPLTGNSPIATITTIRLYYDEIEERDYFQPYYNLGDQLVVSSEDYIFTAQDLSKLALSEGGIYGINMEGKLGAALQDGWVTFTSDSDIYYSGTEFKPTISVSTGIVNLTKNTNFNVSYSNNVNAGTAIATVTGVGNYGGVVNNNFTIQQATVQSITTSSPANQTFTAADHKSASELLSSISLSEVTVVTNGGTQTLPIVWSLTGGTYSPNGGNYTYTGTLTGNNNISNGGVTLSTQIIVTPTTTSTPAVTSTPTVAPTTTPTITPTPTPRPDNITHITIANTTSFENIKINSEQLEEAKKEKKDVTLAVEDENGKELYSWTFSGNDLANSDNMITDINLSMELETISDNPALSTLLENDTDNTHGFVVSFQHDGVLPAQASVRIFVGNQEGIKSGDMIYLYHYNPDTGKLDTLPNSSSYQVDLQGYITVNILHCSDYVLLPEKADSSVVTSLLNQVNITSTQKTLYVGGTKGKTATLQIDLPATLELVSTLMDKTSSSAVGGVMVSYHSSNDKVATVNSKGKITAKGIGKAIILANITLYSGKSKIVKFTITVKAPYITLTKNTNAMKVGGSFTFEAKAYGLEVKDIIWTSTKKSIVVINKKTGDATAKSKGSDYVVATIGEVVKKFKVVVR